LSWLSTLRTEVGKEMSGGDESLEALAEAIERRDSVHDEDAEADLQELIHGLVHVRRESPTTQEFVGEDEFACRSCHMVLHRSRLADRRQSLCVECASHRRPSKHPPHRTARASGAAPR
jgi:hypothetical protein